MTLHGPEVDRRTFVLAGSAALAWAGSARAEAPILTVASRQLEVLGRAATVYGVTGPDGAPGLFATEGDRLHGALLNASPDPLVMHWHGQVLALADQDRARPGGGALAPGGSDTQDFVLTPGTHWAHAHQLSEQQLLAAPMVTRARGAPQGQEVVVMLHDFAFRGPTEILAELTGAAVRDGAAPGAMDHAAMGAMVHANDVSYDAFLANDRTLDDPQVVEVARADRVRLRIINGATATAFWIDTGALQATCLAVDGSDCSPYGATRFALAQGQRLDLMVTIPADGGAFPVLAQVESAKARTGIVLATAKASVARIAPTARALAAPIDLSLDRALRAARPLAMRPADRALSVVLGQSEGYRWTLNGAIHGEHHPLQAALGERVEFTFTNQTSMTHPMHLHGHHFQVVEIGGVRFAGPIRDTVIVPPTATVVVAVDLDKRGDWYLHCHHLYHMAAGMMTELRVA